MSMNWHQRQHGWTCRDCGAFNGVTDYSCQCTYDVEDRERKKVEQRRSFADYYRGKFQRDEVLLRSIGGFLYWVRRHAGGYGKLTYTVLVPGGYSYRVEWYRVPSSVYCQAINYFFRTIDGENRT